jgi:hypothetical protein
MWRVLAYPFLFLVAVAAVPAWGVAIPAIAAVPLVEIGTRSVTRLHRTPGRRGRGPALVLIGGTAMDQITPTSACDVDGCSERTILLLQRPAADGGHVEAGFCERHVHDVALQADVLARAGSSRAA